MTDTLRHGKNQDILDTTAGIAVKGKEGVLLMEAGENMSLTGATLSALGEEGSMILRAGKNLTMDTDSLEAKKDMTENTDNYIRTYRKTETANTLTAGKDITLTAGDNLHARNTTIASEEGAITAKAGKDLTFENGYNETKDDYGLQYKESGFLSHKTTTIKSHDETKTATGSLVSGDTVQMEAGHTTTITGSTIVGTHDVTVTSGKDTTIESAEEKEQHTYDKQVKKSGLMGSGLGFTIGKEKRNDQYQEADTLQKSSTVGSLQGNVTVNANKDIHVDASDIMAGKDISMTGENVTITSKDNVYHSDEKHEYKKSGLTVSASGGVADILTNTIDYAKKASSARDKQLKALYGGEVYETIAKGKDSLNNISEKGMPGIKVGIGSSAFKATSHTETTEAVGSNLVAKGDMQITAKKDIGMKGSTAVADNISMKAGENIQITAAENRSTSDIQESSKSSQAGVGFMPTGNTFYANSSKGKGNETEETVTHTESQVIANKNLTMESGKDTTLEGSQIQGDTVTMKVGNNLTIESVQDKDDYHAKNESKGIEFEVGTSRATHKNGALSAGTTKGQTNSIYESVTDQAGIRAGQGGYDITVKGNTHLKGGLIDSDAAKDKNTLTTGTLTWEDIENKADYNSQNKGQNLTTSWSPKVTDENNHAIGGHKTGITPVQSQPVKGKADSTTKSAISEGTIHITDKDHQKQDVATLPRDTKNSLNQLEKIFDKDTIRERQELATEFAKLGAEKIGDIANEKNWSPNDPRRSLLHGLLGGITAKLGRNSILSGASSGATMEGLQPMLDTFLKDHPEMREEVASLIGYATGKLLGGDGETGSAVAWNGTKFNWLSHEQKMEKERLLEEAESRGDKETVKQIEEYYQELDKEQEEFIISANLPESDDYSDEIENGIISGTKVLRNLREKDINNIVAVEALRLAKKQGLIEYNFGNEDFVTLNSALGLKLGVSGGFILDRKGNVYYATGTGMVFGASIGLTTGKFKADTSNWGIDDYRNAITGISSSFGFSGIFLSGSVAVGSKYADREIGISNGIGLSATGLVNYTEFICNINDL